MLQRTWYPSDQYVLWNFTLHYWECFLSTRKARLELFHYNSEPHDSYQTTRYRKVTSLTWVILSHQHQQNNIFLVWCCFKPRAWQLCKEICTTTTAKGLLEAPAWGDPRGWRHSGWACLARPAQCSAAAGTGTQSHPAGHNKIRSEIKSKPKSRILSRPTLPSIVKAAVSAWGRVWPTACPDMEHGDTFREAWCLRTSLRHFSKTRH